jgi:hypothetical protein
MRHRSRAVNACEGGTSRCEAAKDAKNTVLEKKRFDAKEIRNWHCRSETRFGLTATHLFWRILAATHLFWRPGAISHFFS